MAERVAIYDTVAGSLLVKDVASGHIGSGQIGPHIAGGGVLSAHYGSGSVGFPHVAAAAIRSGHVQSGELTWLHHAAQAILSAQQGSGQIGGVHFNPNDVWPGRVLSGILSGLEGNFFLSGGNPALLVTQHGSGIIAGFGFTGANPLVEILPRAAHAHIKLWNSSYNRNGSIYYDSEHLVLDTLNYGDIAFAPNTNIDARKAIYNSTANVLGQVAFQDNVFCQSGWGYLLPYDLRSGFVSGDVANSGQLAFRVMSAKLDVRLWDGAQHWQGSVALTSSA